MFTLTSLIRNFSLHCLQSVALLISNLASFSKVRCLLHAEYNIFFIRAYITKHSSIKIVLNISRHFYFEGCCLLYDSIDVPSASEWIR